MENLEKIYDMMNKTKRLLDEKEAELNERNEFGWIVEGLILVVVALSGLVGNILCIISFSLKKNKSNFHQLMLGMYPIFS